MTIPLLKVFMSNEAPEAAAQVLTSGYIGQGPMVEEFETLLRSHFTSDYVATVNSGTSALHLALRLIADMPGDEVLTTPLTCTATNWPILANNMRIKWVDVDPQSCNMDIEDLRKKISHRTKAVMVVHWGGQPIDLDLLRKTVLEFSNPNQPIPVIEDCAHAFGSYYKGRPVGSHGNYACFSFQAIKLVTTVDGGAIITPTMETYKRAKLLRWYGIDREVPLLDMRCELDVPEWGYKFHMNDVAAAIGKCNVKHWRRLAAIQYENSGYYDEVLVNVPGLTLLSRNPDYKSSCWLYTLRAKNRDGLMRRLRENGIMSSRVHERNDKHTCVRQFQEYLPQLDALVSDMLCIPVGWWVTHEDRELIARTIMQGW
ncbi:DegT/DnrJ/EryC1/StrS family aminotransferase [Zavarzinella formosa]|uniref:DegT/DnrJ/EryC1/StrS family aminotransferase n=1 Tax=Zavarzinella formosa TaxID=360055 RepID=UPI0002F86477|nr:DegT/DnrJ/EryC1/StrS family aminotransferase [Zavarzinella formosa]